MAKLSEVWGQLMKFTNYCTSVLPLRPLLLVLFATLQLLASGCQFVPDMGDAEPGSNEQLAAATDIDGMEPAAREIVANPYLSDRPSISAKARQQFQLGKEAMQQQNWQQALLHFQWLTSNEPGLSGPFVNLAKVYQQLDQPAKAEQNFKQAIVANPLNNQAYNSYGVFLRKAGRFVDAEASYQAALQVWPDAADTHLNMGILHDLYMGKLTSALEHYQSYQSLQAEPDRQVAGWIIDIQRRLAARQGGA